MNVLRRLKRALARQYASACLQALYRRELESAYANARQKAACRRIAATLCRISAGRIGERTC